MDRIADILVIVDPTIAAGEQPAIIKAHALAKRFDADVELLACDTEYSREKRLTAQWPRSGKARAGKTTARKATAGKATARNVPAAASLPALLDRWAAPLRDDGIHVETHAISGNSLHESVL